MTKATYDNPGRATTNQVWGTTTGMVYHVRAYGVTSRNLISKIDEVTGGHYLMMDHPHRGWLRVDFDPNHVLSGNPPD
jgi:hypothetical protein